MIKYYRGEIMGIFGKIKNLFKKEDEEEQGKKYDEGLSKTRKNFVEKILNINNKYEKINLLLGYTKCRCMSMF